MTTTIPTKAQYEEREHQSAYAHLMAAEKGSLAERKEAAKEFGEAMRDPALIAERLGWLFDGNYGYGEMMRARDILSRPRMNRRAALTCLIAAYEWTCPSAMCIAQWKKLSASEKDMLDRAVDIVIEAAEKEAKEEGGA